MAGFDSATSFSYSTGTMHAYDVLASVGQLIQPLTSSTEEVETASSAVERALNDRQDVSMVERLYMTAMSAFWRHGQYST
ncbi:hypothetical protein IWQ60_009246 [Tieghemiomyces parasiticus]|uniref:Uncharacterized protein n=1 Tax=Tieghemiomyces parasiticus TaxID=78921 RepID=A0A9W7ZNP8_9FUNG|nr:hypothetical protein IWQ60_009246 [Tieghemiomyces parasiticus]